MGEKKGGFFFFLRWTLRCDAKKNHTHDDKKSDMRPGASRGAVARNATNFSFPC